MHNRKREKGGAFTFNKEDTKIKLAYSRNNRRNIMLRKMIKKVNLLVLTIILILQNVITVIAYSPSESNALTYGSDRFSQDYALGYFGIDSNSESVGCNVTTEWWINDGTLWHTTNNKSRNENIYVKHYNGAYMNGKYYDIKEYIWVLDGGTMAISHINGGSSGWNTNRCMREFHFYESGTLNSSNPIEVSFKGIVQLSDFDNNEGYTINNVNRAYLTNPTNVKYCRK